MSDRTKARIAFAEAIVEAMWVKGLISRDDRDKINRKNREKFTAEVNC